MTIKQFDKIIEVVRNGGTVIVDKSTNEFSSFDEITENTDIRDIFDYDKEGYSFYIKDDTKSYYELESI